MVSAIRGRAFTAEDREKARVARMARAQASAGLRRDFLDANEWDRLAKAAGVRLPMWAAPATRGSMARWLQKLGVSSDFYCRWSGYARLEQWTEANPTWPLRAFVGLLLEQREAQNRGPKGVLS